jgi:hypothetical protein
MRTGKMQMEDLGDSAAAHAFGGTRQAVAGRRGDQGHQQQHSRLSREVEPGRFENAQGQFNTDTDRKLGASRRTPVSISRSSTVASRPAPRSATSASRRAA